MDDGQRRAAKARLIAGMLQGQPWHVAAWMAGLPIKRATAYRLVRKARLQGDAALCDGRHGHASKLRAPIRHWLVDSCRASPHIASWEVQAMLVERFGITVNVRQINNARAALGVSRVPHQGAGQGVGGKWGPRHAA